MSKSSKSKHEKKPGKKHKNSDDPLLTHHGDPRVGRALGELGYKHRLEEDGSYHMVFQMPQDRSQVCVVSSKTFEMLGQHWRKVFSPALKSFGSFDARTANLLLRETCELPMGSWLVEADEDNDHVAIFQIDVPADAPAEALAEAIQCVTLVADHMEFRLSGQDEF